jgi:signal transduction histidine kinase
MLAAAPCFSIAVFLALFASEVAPASTSANQASLIAQKPLSAVQRQEDMLVVGSEQDYPPFATGMTDATAGGFTVDLWRAVAAETGLNYTIRVRPFHQLLQEFKEGKIDVLINLAQSDKRRQFADFTVPHVIVYGAIFVRKGESGIRSEGDLAGKSIIVLKADLAHDYAVSRGWEKQLMLADTSAEGLQLLASGKHDAMLLSKLAGMQVLQALGPTNIEALEVKAGFSQKFAFAVAKGQSELLGKLNEGLALTKSSGTYDALYDKWFGIYEVKGASPRDVLKYIIPIVVSFLVIATYFFYRRQVERKQAEAALRRLAERLTLTNRELEQANRMKTDFMANVTHELRTPLNSVIGFAELLKDEVPGPLNAKQAAFAADIVAAGERLLALVEGILEMSRLDAVGTALEREPVEIGAALEDRVAAQRKAAEAKRVSIALEVAADAGRAELNPEALRRMLDALLDNAIKFNREGGTVAVSARRTGGTLEIGVTDTGIGIARKDLAKLFKPLVQLDAGIARGYGGVGLGLALARRLAELHGGAIEVESEPGKGSTFTLRFPIHDRGQVLH